MNTKDIINELRDVGCKVSFRYERDYIGSKLCATGGSTTCSILLPEGIRLESIAFCSTKDRFVKQLGRELSLARVVHFYMERIYCASIMNSSVLNWAKAQELRWYKG